jgi:hypothetical protein
MININYLRNGGSIISHTYISKSKELEEQIMKKVLKKRIEYLNMSNAFKDLMEFKYKQNKHE